MKLESRAVDSFAAGEDGKISGRAIVFNSQSVDFGDWVEVMMPGSVELMDDLYLDFDHQSQYILGRESNQTLETTVSDDGVDFVATPPNTTWAKDLMESMRAKYVAGCSFCFECVSERWEWVEDRAVRFIEKCRVYSLTVTGIPAYPETSSEARDAANKKLPEASLEKLKQLRDAAKPAASDDTETIVPDETEPEAHGAKGDGHSQSDSDVMFYSEHLGLMKETQNEA